MEDKEEDKGVAAIETKEEDICHKTLPHTESNRNHQEGQQPIKDT